MRHITITDVHIRLRGLQNIQQESQFFTESAYSIINSKNPADVFRFIEGVAKSDNAMPFYTYIELLESLIETGNVGDINKVGTFIIENIIHKIRDSKSTQSLIKRRLTRMQNKIKNGISKSLKNASEKFKSKSNRGLKREQAVVEIYETMLEKSIIMHHCDRVIENYNRISKRFNLDSLFVENTRYNGVKDTVVELCNRIDTYDMPNNVKFNTIIETAWYGFESNYIDYKKSEILESAVDYFYFKEDGISVCKEILDSTLFFDKNEDMGNIDIITEEEPEQKTSENIDESIMLYSSTNINNIKTINESSFEELFNKFKQEELSKTDKPENKLKELITKLYAKNVSSIIEDTPDLLHWIRRFFIIGSAALPVIGPVLAVIGIIADKFISLHYERQEVAKMIKCFNNEIKASKNKLKTTDNSEEKERLAKYIDSLEKARDKIDSYYNDLLTDEEQEARYEEMDEDDFDFDDDFSDYLDDDDFDFDDEFLEAALLKKTAKNIESFISATENSFINESSMYNIVFNLSDDDLINVAKITSSYPDTFYKDSFIDGIECMLKDIRKGSIEFATIVDKVTKITSLKSALEILQKSNNNYNDEDNIYNSIKNIDALYESYNAINILIDTYNNQHHLLEASISNTIKMASMKLKNALTKMGDKERSVSRNIDVGLNSFRKGVERALTNDNRESIIRGTILPSASKIIKLCLVNAGLIALHQPLLAIITTLGYIGVSAKFKAKERQMIIDEIDIELEMCEKYINIAEQKNDMKALRQLLSTKKELERQRQRIKYKMKVEFGQKYTDSVDGSK